MIVLLSAQHSGTRFTASFLESINVIYRQYHSEYQRVDELRHETSSKAVIPVRDPLLIYTSTFMRNPERVQNLDDVVARLGLLMEMEKWFDFTYLRLTAEDRGAELQKVADFCEGTYTKFDWEPIGNLKPTPTDYTMWEFISDKMTADEKNLILDSLAESRAHYGF